jgi:hypothetical protein
MSRKVFWIAALAVATIAVEFGSVNTASAQWLRRNRCCAQTTCCTTTSYTARRTPIRTMFARYSNDGCCTTSCCDTNNCGNNCGNNGYAQACCTTPECNSGCGQSVATTACGCATANRGCRSNCGCGTMTASYSGGCRGVVAPVSYSADCNGCGSAVGGCVGDGCGGTSSDTVIESDSAPIDAPGVETTVDDKEA